MIRGEDRSSLASSATSGWMAASQPSSLVSSEMHKLRLHISSSISGRSIPVVRAHGVRLDRVQFPAARQLRVSRFSKDGSISKIVPLRVMEDLMSLEGTILLTARVIFQKRNSPFMKTAKHIFVLLFSERNYLQIGSITKI